MKAEDCEGCHERPDPGGAGWCRMFRLRPKEFCNRNYSKRELKVDHLNAVVKLLCFTALMELEDELGDGSERVERGDRGNQEGGQGR